MEAVFSLVLVWISSNILVFSATEGPAARLNDRPLLFMVSMVTSTFLLVFGEF